MKRMIFRIGLALFLVSGIYMYGIGRGDIAMKTALLAAERPPIDRAISAKLETATFALG